MNIVVIGGAGFIGSHLVDRLLAEGHSVDVVDDLSSGGLANLAEARVAGGKLKIHHLDSTTAEGTSLIGMRRPDVMYHLGVFPRPQRSLNETANGFASALTVLDAARQFGVGKVVVALPATALYGLPSVRSLPVKETDPVPRGVRGVVARAVFDLLSTYREQEMVEFSALALASVYGARQHHEGGVVAAFQRAIDEGSAASVTGDGRQTRDFIYIDDVVDALVRAGERSTGLLINVGTGVQTSIRDLWTKMSGDALGAPNLVPARRDELLCFAASPVRARIHLGWSSWTDLDAGLIQLRSRS